MSAPICLVVNPTAGGGRAGRLAPEAQRALSALGLTVRRVDTRDLDHARALATEAAVAGETVVTLSGDGLVGAVADVLRGLPDALMGVLPGGRGNDLARVLGIPSDLASACEVIAHGVPQPMDLGQVGPSTFVGIASAGFDSEANRIANEAPPRLGNLVYAYGALRALLTWRPARFEIELDPPGERHSFRGYSVAVANSRAYGGGMYLAPDALLDDGLLEIVVIEHLNRLRYLAYLPRVFKGTHVELPWVHVFRARAVELSADRPFTLYADGDPIGELPVRVNALERVIRVLVPAGQAGRSAFSQADHSLGSDSVVTPPGPR